MGYNVLKAVPEGVLESNRGNVSEIIVNGSSS